MVLVKNRCENCGRIQKPRKIGGVYHLVCECEDEEEETGDTGDSSDF